MIQKEIVIELIKSYKKKELAEIYKYTKINFQEWRVGYVLVKTKVQTKIKFRFI